MAVGIDFYDELEMLVASRNASEIIFMKDGGKSIIHGIVSNLSDNDADAFLTMASGLEIHLRDLVEINGKSPSNLC